jgi:hypothetical protein
MNNPDSFAPKTNYPRQPIDEQAWSITSNMWDSMTFDQAKVRKVLQEKIKSKNE